LFSPRPSEPASESWGNVDPTPIILVLEEAQMPVLGKCEIKDTPKEFNCFEEASQNPRFPAASASERGEPGVTTRSLDATSKKLNQYIALFNLSEVALLLYVNYPTFSSLRCGECGVL